MRWVILSDDWPPQLGGVATWSYGAARGLIEAGHSVRVFCRRRQGLVALDGGEVTGVRGRSFGRHGALWTAVRGAHEWSRADAVLATTWAMGTAVAEPLRALGIPLHVVFHGSGATRPPRDPAALARVRSSARLWAVSRYLAEIAGAEWIPSPVEMGPSTWDRRGPWVMVARATPLKGGDRFVRICAAAGVPGVVVGDGPELTAWRELAARLGAPVQFRGALDRPSTRAVLDGAGASFLLSRAEQDGSGAEGLGLVLLEARAHGVLAVGSQVGGIPEVAELVLDDPDDAERSAHQVSVRLADHDGSGLDGHGRPAVAQMLTG